MYQLGQALNQLYVNDIMHRDLKPQNILLDRSEADAVLKLADFGLAKYIHPNMNEGEKDCSENTVCGTPVYMAPEIRETNGIYDKTADLWSCGIIFLEMLVGNKPWSHCLPGGNVGRLKKEFWKSF